MAAPTMTGAEFAGRVFALEALLIMLAAELLAERPEDQVQTLFSGVKELTQGVIDELTPTIGATPAVVKDLERHASDYVNADIEAISRLRLKLMKAAAAK